MKDLLYNRKKIIGIILMFIAIVLLIYLAYTLFFSSKDRLLVCKTKQLYIDDEINILYVDDKIDKVTYKMIYDLSTMPDETYRDLKEDIKKNIRLCRDYNHVGHEFSVISCKQEIKGEVVRADMVLSARKVSNINLKELKKILEETNYTCEVKRPQ